MTAPTRRQIVAGSLAAVGAAGAPAIAIAASPDERLRNAVQEMQDAMQARWPEGGIDVIDRLSKSGKPVVLFMAHETDQERQS